MGMTLLSHFIRNLALKVGKEYQYTKAVTIENARTVTSVPMVEKKDFDKMVEILDQRAQNAKMYMVGNSGLYMFYLSQFMQENVFYLKEYDTYVITEEEEDTLILHAILGDGEIDEVIKSFGSNIKNVVLFFTPKDPSGFEKSEYHEEDTTLFVKGSFFEETKDAEFIFQAITHA